MSTRYIADRAGRRKQRRDKQMNVIAGLFSSLNCSSHYYPWSAHSERLDRALARIILIMLGTNRCAILDVGAAIYSETNEEKNDASLWNFNCLHPKVNCFYFHVQRAALQRFKCPYFFYLCLWIYKNIKSPFASSNIACLRKQCALHLVLCRFMVYLLFMCLPLFNLSRF